MKKKFLAGLATGLFLFGMVEIASATLLTNAGFEQEWTGSAISGPGYAYRPIGTDIGWSFTDGAGVSENNTAWGGTAQEGTQFAFLQCISSISQDFILSSTSDLSVDFYWALRPHYNNGQQIAISIDGVELNALTINSMSWTNSVLNLGTFSAGSHSLTFAGISNYSDYGDTSAFIDNVQLTASPTSPDPVPEPATMLLFCTGLTGLVGNRIRRKRK